MSFHACIYQNPELAVPVEPLVSVCRRENLEVRVWATSPALENLRGSLPQEPAILFLPAVERDCLGVKMAQAALLDAPPKVFDAAPRVILLYGPELPSKQFLCLAFREGVDDVVALDAGEEALGVQVARAMRVLRGRIESSLAGGELNTKIRALQRVCERFEQQKARWEERYQMLVSTSVRMALGELRLNDLAPRLLIAATSASQAAAAQDVATQMGFMVQVAHRGADAMEMMETTPPNVLLTDGTLPDMDATGLAFSARQILGSRPLHVIAWSGNAEAEDAFLAPDGGVDDFVLKTPGETGAHLLAAALLGGLR
ncbi:MAG TPA: response regulator [Candidatus Sumerlaeota bacterium]|nr:response regulator [Candidatus Sumerlaeota bacterium]